jgi:Tol biopolymer transport system component
MGRVRRFAVVAAVVTASLLMPAGAEATFPGKNGKIAFETDSTSNPSGLWIMNADGSALAPLTHGLQPAWSPDGTKIAFQEGGPSDPDCDNVFILCNYDIWIANADGTGRTQLTTTSDADRTPAWTPDGLRVTFAREDSSHTSRPYSINANGTGETQLPFPVGAQTPAWSPDGTRLAYAKGTGSGDSAIYLANADGTGEVKFCCDDTNRAYSPDWSPDQRTIVFDYGADGRVAKKDIDASGSTQISNQHDIGPKWSPDGTRIVFASTRDGSVYRLFAMDPDGSNTQQLTTQRAYGSSWQPIPINSYPRPRGASPMKISLVPSNRQCTTPNSTHGAPLAYGSCAPPQLASGRLTTGTPDSNGLPVRMDATLLLRVVPGNAATTADEADVRIGARLNDVFNKDLSDYTGALRASLPLRITDKDNTPSPGGPGAGTTVAFLYGFDIPCTPDPAANLGSDCAISTSADTLVPGTIKEGLRAIWQIGRVRVDDAGPDGNPDTSADNTVFAVQGVFIP